MHLPTSMNLILRGLVIIWAFLQNAESGDALAIAKKTQLKSTRLTTLSTARLVTTTTEPRIIRDTGECQDDPSLCGQNKVCVNVRGSNTCECKEGWTGDNCKTDVDECLVDSNACHGHGKCTNFPGSFECECGIWWTGRRCQIDKIQVVHPDDMLVDFPDVDHCLSNPCPVNSMCTTTGSSYECTCIEGWEGLDCNQDINECQNSPSLCAPNGECVNTKGGYSCKCQRGWKGDDCRTDINECESNESPCSGNGNCTNSKGTYLCSCNRNWEGSRCEKRVDPCLSNPCPENSVCKVTGSSYECTCMAGWEGPDCSQKAQMEKGPCADTCQGRDVCYVGYNCTHYDHCYTRHNVDCHCTRMVCSFGTLWNAKLNICDRAGQVECISDPCLNLPYRSTYPSHFNCRTFYQCNKNNQSLPVCCEKGFAYDHEVQECLSSLNCNINCTERENMETTMAPPTPKVTMETCYFQSISESPDKYLNTVSNIVQDCPVGTVFKREQCVCVRDGSSVGRECVPLVYVNFTGEGIKNLSPQQIYMQVDGVRQEKFGTSNVTYGFFNGRSSSIEIPRLSAVALPRLMIQLQFFALQPATSRYQVLVSNCQSSAKTWDISEVAQDQSPSLAIIADTVDEQLTFLGYSETLQSSSVNFSLPYKADAWNKVELVYDGSSFKGSIQSQHGDLQTFYKEEEKPFSGRIVASYGPLRLGRCSDNDVFYGCLEMVKVFDCVSSP